MTAPAPAPFGMNPFAAPVLGYAAATSAAFTASAQAFDLFSQSLRSFSVAPTRAAPVWPWSLPSTASTHRMPAVGLPAPWASLPAEIFWRSFSANPFSAMAPLGTTARPAWPLAAMLVAFGVPQAWAWPTAEASAATMRLADTAKDSAQRIFASYRSGEGFATTPVIPPQAVAGALLVAAGLMLTAPWIASNPSLFS